MIGPLGRAVVVIHITSTDLFNWPWALAVKFIYFLGQPPAAGLLASALRSFATSWSGLGLGSSGLGSLSAP